MLVGVVRQPAPKVAAPPASSAAALQAFHTEEANAAKPSVQRANVLRGQLAVVGANDRAASAKYLPAPKPKSTGVLTHIGTKLGGASAPTEASVQLASILDGRSLANFMKAPAGVLGHLGKQIYHLPQSTLEGSIGFGGALAHDLVHPFAGHSETGAIIDSAVTHDPVVQSIVHGSPKYLERNPLGTLLDATGVYGVVGKTAGALGAAGDVARGARLAAPGVEGSAVARAYSSNAITHALQRAGEKVGPKLAAKVPGATRVLAARAEHDLRLQNAAAHTAERGQYGAELAHIHKTLAAVKPAGKEEAAVAPLVAMTGQNRVGLERLYNNVARGGTPPEMHPETVASRERMLTDLRAMMVKDNAGKFDWASTNRAASAYHSLAALQEAQKAALGTHDIAQMSQRLDNARALLEPHVHYLQKPVSDPRLFSALQDAVSRDKEAKAGLSLAQRQRAAYAGAAGSRGAYSAAQSALGQIQHAIPVHPATDALLSRVLGLRQAINAAHPNLKAFHDANVESAKEVAASTADAVKTARKAFRTQKLRGTVIQDASIPALRSGPLKGLNVRPLEASDVAAIRHGDPAIQSYVSARNPERLAPQPVSLALGKRAGDRIIPMAERGQAPYSGAALEHGDLRTGWSALPNTLLKNAASISEERQTQAFLDRFELKNRDASGAHRGFATPADAQRAANAYHAEHGIKMSTLADRNGGLHIVPSAAVKELNAQRALDTRGNTLLAKTNRIFRKTVLPYSPKLPVMHTVENATRVAALEKGNLLRIAPDYFRGRAILKAASPSAGERLASLVTPGSLTRSGSSGEAEDLGHLVTEPRALPVEAVRRAAGAMGELSNQIIRGQRWLEHGAQTVALGAHGRQLLQEMGHSWTDANTTVNAYADKLAQRLATPADAERAAKAMHTAMGKYNGFTATTRAGLRVMPFGSWYMNAARLVFVTLPRDHPLFDALLQDIHTAQQKQWDAAHAGLPADMQDSLPVGQNAYLDIGKLTPIGLPGQAPETTAAQLVLPQFSGAVAALFGKDAFGNDLKGPSTGFGQSASPAGIQSKTGGQKAQAALSAIDALLSGMAGPTSDIARIVYGHGGVLYNTSTPTTHLLTGGLLGHVDVKPGTPGYKKGILNLPGPLDKVLDPFHPTTFHVKAASTGPSRAFGGSSRAALGTTNSRSFGSSTRQ